jgi:hypothetical protein
MHLDKTGAIYTPPFTMSYTSVFHFIRYGPEKRRQKKQQQTPSDK